MSAGPVEVCVGRVSKAHGVRGELAVEVRTDEPHRRFAVGHVLRLEPRHPGPPGRVTLAGVRRHQERLLVTFDEVPDRTSAEACRGALLYAELAGDEVPDDPEEFYDHQLVGLRVEDESGAPLGVVRAVLHHAGQDLLDVDADGREVLVPFVTALVPTVDPGGGRLVVADRPGLFAPEEGG